MLQQARRGLQEGRGHKPLPRDTPHALPVQSLPVECCLNAMAKKYTKSQITGGHGASLIAERVFSMGHVYQATGDLEAGIDGYIEIRDPETEEATGLTVAVQSKATAGRVTAETNERFEYLLDERDLDYWLSGNLPVLLVVSRPQSGEAYYKSIKEYFSSGEDARQLLIDTLRIYRREHGHAPARLVVHKTSPFSGDEKEGLWAAAESECIEFMDLLHVRESKTRLFRKGYHPPLRGTFASLDRAHNYLYTVGSVNFYQMTFSNHMPQTLQFDVADSVSPPRQLAEEILKLTKMNWNNTQISQMMPVTIEAARHVGNLLKYADREGLPAQALAQDPIPEGAKQLSGNPMPDEEDEVFFQIRVGDYRVIYTIEEERLLVLVVRVRHRRDAYR